jgi:ferredoxin--NADP+ reductase
MHMLPSAVKHFHARILDRRDLSPDLWLLRLDPGGPFEFRAGQYATLGFERDGQRTERAYSIVSSPYEKFLEFFLELVPHGGLTPHLHTLGAGDTLLCRKIAKGRFTLDLRTGRTHHLLVSTVTGIAPFVSYVRTLYRVGTRFIVCKVRAGRGSLVIAKNWKKLRRKRRGSNMSPP